MIDYLELCRQEDGDALWEAVQQMVNPLLETVAKQAQLADGEVETAVEHSEVLPLYEEVLQHRRLAERLDWLGHEPQKHLKVDLVEADEQEHGIRWDKSMDDSANVGEVPVTPGRTSENPWEMGQAERLDQIFRRDSRRYDGGFFLY